MAWVYWKKYKNMEKKSKSFDDMLKDALKQSPTISAFWEKWDKQGENTALNNEQKVPSGALLIYRKEFPDGVAIVYSDPSGGMHPVNYWYLKILRSGFKEEVYVHAKAL